ncbi:MAG: aminoacyl-tRNA hydrolase [Candidatus Omnitrophica bacterium]|nr:aminoacyl-tRNA hydrolase [Candidatus Omnitrophota bacterium]
MKRKFIVGLGNPGKEYRCTRHNLGFLVAERIAEQYNVKFRLSSLINGFLAEVDSPDHKISILMPVTFMNHSGKAVAKMMAKNGIEEADMLVICDDLNLDFGQARIRAKGRDGGHNGLGSIIDTIGSSDFHRLRLGIGRPNHDDVVDYVLKNFLPQEQEMLPDFIGKAVDCTNLWLSDGIERAMEIYNKKVSKNNNDS